MSEQIERGTEAIGDPAAVSLALAGASRPEADAYLRDQRHHLHEQLNQILLTLDKAINSYGRSARPENSRASYAER